MIVEIDCLIKGTQSRWPVWSGSLKKLAGIVAAINALPEAAMTNLSETLSNKECELYKSLFKPLVLPGSGKINPHAEMLNDIQRILDIFEFLNTERLNRK